MVQWENTIIAEEMPGSRGSSTSTTVTSAPSVSTLLISADLECDSFPPDFPETIQSQHRLYGDVKECPCCGSSISCSSKIDGRLSLLLKTDTSVLGHTGLFDDDSDAEGDQVFVPMEIANLVEEGEDEDDLEGSADSSEEAAGGGPSGVAAASASRTVTASACVVACVSVKSAR